MLLRAIRPSDAANLRAFHARCSEETQYRRFFMYKPHLSNEEAEYLCSVDMRNRGAFVASELNSSERIRGIGQWDSLSGSNAEIAFVVEDAVQGLGIGRRLVNAVLDRTRAVGLCQLTGFILAGNRPMRHLFETSGYTFNLGQSDCGVHSFSLVT
ncbi:MAG: GNAT family N-acetyltransferase [Solirubrobacterales bacterium]|nr:GNAT family N-acetyltransferase [Solirubrobacterales bacterium]